MKQNKSFNLTTIGLFTFLIITLNCCKKDDSSVLTIKTIDANQQSKSAVFVDILDGLTNLSPRYQSNSSDAVGELKFSLKNNKSYNIYLVPASGYIGAYLGNSDARYIVAGKFESQEEIDNYAIQKPVPKVGGTKYEDINYDGIVDALDLVIPVSIKSDKTLTLQLKVK